MRRTTRVQLVVFLLISVSVVAVSLKKNFDLDKVWSRPYVVEAQFTKATGIYPRADVDLLGTRIGSVREIKVGPGSGSTVVLAIDKGVEIPKDVIAAVGNKSAIGEPYIQLTPQSSGGALLADGSLIPKEDTVPPVDVAKLLTNVDGLAGSISTRDLAVVIAELAAAVRDLGPTMGRLLEDTDTVTGAALENVDSLTALIDDAATVLDTQVELGPQTTTYLREIASLTATLRELDPTFDEVFVHGIRAGAEVTNLLRDNQAALPILLTNLLAVTDVAGSKLPALRKTLVVFPWVIEMNASLIRYCDEIDPQTGKPIQSTCQYDENGKPVYSAHFALQLPELPGKAPYLPCVKGYEGTVKYHPNGDPMGSGKREPRDSPPNRNVRCAASPTDPDSPNVRGSQNAHDYGSSEGRSAPNGGVALYNPNNGMVAAPGGTTYHLTGATGSRPPHGEQALGWLLTQPMAN